MHSPTPHSSENQDAKKLSIIQQTFTKTPSNRVEPTRQRSTIGGKSPAAVKHSQGSQGRRRRTRMSSEQLKQLSRRIDLTEPLLSPHVPPVKPALPALRPPMRKRSRLRADDNSRSISKRLDHDTPMQHNETSAFRGRPSLYNTCANIWPGPASLGEFSHENIKCLSELLKVRLSQAKFRVLATLESVGTRDDNLSSYLQTNNCSTWLSLRERNPIKLSTKRHRSTCALTTVGSGKNLFTRNTTQKRPRPPTGIRMEDILDWQHTKHLTNHHDVNVSTSDGCQHSKTPMKDRKRLSQRPLTAKDQNLKKPGVEKELSAQKRPQPKGASIVPITLDDGSRAFVCEPCNKKYKNRGGLAYHLDRCKFRVQEDDAATRDVEDPNAIVNCICDNPAEDSGMMVQCDDCKAWLHFECTGVREDALDDNYRCPRCIADLASFAQNGRRIKPSDVIHAQRKSKDLLQNLKEAQEADKMEETSTSKSRPDIDIFNIFADEPIQPTAGSIIHIDEPRNAEDEFEDEGPRANLWDDFSLPSNQDWSQLSEDEPYSAYDTALGGTSWDMSELSLMQPPSLLFSDNTLGSALEDDITSVTPAASASTPLSCDMTNQLPSEVLAPNVSSSLSSDQPDSLWFEFANFDDDFHCGARSSIV
ncbi:hypothetical protein DFQ28_008216 [Apophysomyces sp. BC1034]|nr:hypothetical protein DFQ30_007694 [Apophysomyces sp. BC1015]KAG0181951.1 hypothetical protein DFQ29_006348 [Apophysomyces sp. BC1021]KAG0192709.1 hypothetical protein DFQ28_008216 [Apophysomyces sp. BC1034]